VYIIVFVFVSDLITIILILFKFWKTSISYLRMHLLLDQKTSSQF